MSRCFFFAWWNTRPDMLCSFFGLAALYYGLRFLDSPTKRLAFVVGLFVGLALLSHPFAIVFVIQVTGILLLCRTLPWQQRCVCLVITGTTAAAVLSLWIPLILIDTDAFRVQFTNNVLSRTGPGLASRLLWPWSSLGFQIDRFLERAGAIQVVICGIAIIVSLATLLLRPGVQTRRAVVIGLSALYLHLACVGSHGMTDYWCYTWSWVVVLLAVGAQCVGERIDNVVVRRSVLLAVLSVVLMSLIPGSGIRTFWVYLTKSDGFQYNRREFCRQVNDRLPADARLLVAADYVFEFEVLGRKPINAFTHRVYHDVSDIEFDYLVASRQNIRDGMPKELGCNKLWNLGIRDDSLSCYVEVYERADIGNTKAAWPR